MASSIGNITALNGKFYIEGVDKSLREIAEGDEVFDGEVIVGAKNNTQLDNVIVALYDGSNVMVIGEESQLFDKSLTEEEFSKEETITQKDSIQALLEESGGIENIEDIETAAGDETAGVESSEGGEAVFAESNNANANVNADLLDKDVINDGIAIEDVDTQDLDYLQTQNVVESQATDILGEDTTPEIPEDTIAEDTTAPIPEDTTPEDTSAPIPEDTTPALVTGYRVEEDTTDGIVNTPASDEITTDENTVAEVPENTIAEIVNTPASDEITTDEQTIDAVAEDTTNGVTNVEASAEQTTDEQTTDAVAEDTTDEDTTPAVDESTTSEDTTPAKAEQTVDEDTTDAVDEDTTPEDTIDAVAEDTVDEVINTPASDEITVDAVVNAEAQDEDTTDEDTTDATPENTIDEDTTDAVPESTVDEDTTDSTPESTVDEDTNIAEDTTDEQTTDAIDEQTVDAVAEDTVDEQTSGGSETTDVFTLNTAGDDSQVMSATHWYERDIDLGGESNTLEIDVRNLNGNNGFFGNETMIIEAYDADGNLVDTFEQLGNNGNASESHTFTSDSTFTSITISGKGWIDSFEIENVVATNVQDSVEETIDEQTVDAVDEQTIDAVDEDTVAEQTGDAQTESTVDEQTTDAVAEDTVDAHVITHQEVDVAANNADGIYEVDGHYYKDIEASDDILIGTFNTDSERADVSDWGEVSEDGASAVFTQGDVTITTSVSDGTLRAYNSGHNHVGEGIGSNDKSGLDRTETMTFDINGADINEVTFVLSGLGSYFDESSSHATEVKITAFDVNGNEIETQGGYRESGSYEDSYSFVTDVPVSSFAVTTEGSNGNFVIQSMTLVNTMEGTVEVQPNYMDVEENIPEVTTDAIDEDTTAEDTSYVDVEDTTDEQTVDAVAENTIDEATTDAVAESTVAESTVDAVAEDTTDSVVITPASQEDTTPEDTTDPVAESTVAEDTTDAVSEQTTDEIIDVASSDESTFPEQTIDATSESTTPQVINTAASDEVTTPEIINTAAAVEQTVDEDTTPEVIEDTTDDVINTPASDEVTTDENTVDEVDEDTIDEDTTDAVAEDTDPEDTVDAVDESTVDEDTSDYIDIETNVELTDGYSLLDMGDSTELNLGNLDGLAGEINVINLSDGEQSILSVNIEDVLNVTDADNVLRIDGDSSDSIDLNTMGEDAEWELGDFKTDAETGQTYQEVTSVGTDETVILEVNTDVEITQS